MLRLAGVSVFLGIALTFVHRSVAAHTPPAKKCPGSAVPASNGWVPVPSQAKLDCLREIASHQVAATTIQQDLVPSYEPDCATDPSKNPNTTQVATTAYLGMSGFSYQDYKNNEGFIVARIDNPSNCTTKSYGLRPGHSYFVVVENRGTAARLVDIADPSASDIKLKKFSSCTADNHPPNFPEHPYNLAFLRSSSIRCNHDPVPEGQINGLFLKPKDRAAVLETKSRLRGRLIDVQFAIWISCGSDCCFADAM